MLTPAEQYAEGTTIFGRGMAAMLAREESAAADVEQGIATVMEAMRGLAAAYIERAQASQRERDACVEAAGAMDRLAADLGVDTQHPVPPSRVAMDGPASAVHRAASRGVSAVVFELGSIVAARAAREM